MADFDEAPPSPAGDERLWTGAHRKTPAAVISGS